MPLYVADYLADTAHLSAAQSGAYLHLIMHYWLFRGLPSDDRSLCRIAKMTPSEWRKSKSIVQAYFFDGWRHGRVEHEIAEAERISAAGRKGGEASGQARRARAKSTNDSGNDPPCGKPTIDERSTNDRPTKPEALQLPLLEERKKDAANAAPSEDADYYRRGKQILGEKASGFLAKLKAAKGGNVALARAALEMATTKNIPREYLARIIHGQASTEAEQNKKVEEIMRKKGSAVVFADEVPGGIPGIV